MYAKVFAQIYDGTLCTKGPWESLVTFQQLLVLSDPEGNVDMTAEAISRRTTIPLQIIKKGIEELLKPDPESRTPTDDGKRIVPLCEGRAWGWRIVNYVLYRGLKREEDRREYHRNYWNEKRSPKVKKQSLKKLNKTQQPQPNQPKKEKGESSKEKVDKKKLCNLPADFSITDSIRAWSTEHGYTQLEQRLDHFRDWAIGGDKRYTDWDATFRNAIRGDWAHLTPSAVVPIRGNGNSQDDDMAWHWKKAKEQQEQGSST